MHDVFSCGKNSHRPHWRNQIDAIQWVRGIILKNVEDLRYVRIAPQRGGQQATGALLVQPLDQALPSLPSVVDGAEILARDGGFI